MKKFANDYYLKKLKALPDASVRIFDRPVVDIHQVRKVHIVGVCGTAMGSLAGLFVEAGYAVSGSDTGCYPPMSDLITEIGVKFKEGYSEKNIGNADIVVVGNAIGPQNPEAKYARENNLPTLSLAEALQKFFMQEKRSLVVAGTHGKTTTTGLLVHVLRSAVRNPGYMVGGVMVGHEKSFGVGAGEYFILEGDEYDTAYFDKRPKFLNYRPTSAIVTSVEFDHADIYSDVEEYRQAFAFFSEEVSDTLVLYGDDPVVRDLAEHTDAQILTYGLTEEVDITAKDIETSEQGQGFTLSMKGNELGRLFVPMSGEHNLLNTLAVCALCLSEGLSLEEIKEGLNTFKGLKRRQEVRGIVNDIIVIDDFAHHPTAVRETIKAIEERYPSRRLIAVFEPRSNTSRSTLFEREYEKSFDHADLVYLSVPPFIAHRDSKDDMMDVEKLAEAITKRGIEAYGLQGADAIVNDFKEKAQLGDVILVMSNGGFEGIHEKLLQSLESRK